MKKKINKRKVKQVATLSLTWIGCLLMSAGFYTFFWLYFKFM